MNPTDRSEQGDDKITPENLSPADFDATRNKTDVNTGTNNSTDDDASVSDGNTLKISHKKPDEASTNPTSPSQPPVAAQNPTTPTAADPTLPNPVQPSATTIDRSTQPIANPITSPTQPTPRSAPTAAPSANSTPASPTDNTNPTPAPTPTPTHTPTPNINPATNLATPTSTPNATPGANSNTATPPISPTGNPTKPTARPNKPVNPLARPTPMFTGTPRSARPTNNPFANQGDIMLQTDQPPKKSKKPLVIGLLAVAVIAIVGVAAVFSLTSGKSTTQNASVQTSFNQYANYILFEKETDESLDEDYATDRTYKISEEIDMATYEPTKNSAFFEKTQQKFNTFYDSMNNSDAYSSDNKNQLNEYKKRLDFLVFYAYAKKVSDGDLSQKYLSGSTISELTNYVDKTYAPFLQSSSQLTQQYGKNMITQLKEYNIPLLQAYQDAGCIQENGYVPSCMREVQNNFKPQLSIPTDELPERMLRDAVILVTKDCWSLKQVVGGETS